MSVSTQTYIPETQVGDLEVLSIYRQLIAASVDKDSLYIRTKETLNAFLDEQENGTITPVDRANILSQALVAMTTNLTSQAMSMAVEIAKENRDGVYKITKLREETLLVQEQRDKLATDREHTSSQTRLVEAQTNKTTIDGWKIQSDMVRDNGVTTFPDISVPVMNSSYVGSAGTKWEQIQQMKSGSYATIAKAFRDAGNISWSVDSTTGNITALTDKDPAAPGLIKAQEKVAIRQEKAFDDNKRQHAANSSANMIGILLSAEESGNITADDVTKWRTAVDYLNSDT